MRLLPVSLLATFVCAFNYGAMGGKDGPENQSMDTVAQKAGHTAIISPTGALNRLIASGLDLETSASHHKKYQYYHHHHAHHHHHHHKASVKS